MSRFSVVSPPDPSFPLYSSSDRASVTTEERQEAKGRMVEYLIQNVHCVPTNNSLQNYIVQDSSEHPDGHVVRCSLCATGWMTRGEMERHVKEHPHVMHFGDLKTMRDNKWQIVLLTREYDIAQYQERAHSLGLDKWQWHISHLIMEYMRSPADRPQTKRLALIKETLEKYEQMERISLLELAVWKQLHSKQYTNDGKRIIPGIHVIVQGVMPFLGNAEADETVSTESPPVVQRRVMVRARRIPRR